MEKKMVDTSAGPYVSGGSWLEGTPIMLAPVSTSISTPIQVRTRRQPLPRRSAAQSWLLALAALIVLIQLSVAASSMLGSFQEDNAVRPLSNAALLSQAVQDMRSLNSYHAEVLSYYDGFKYTASAYVDRSSYREQITTSVEGSDFEVIYVGGTRYLRPAASGTFKAENSDLVNDNVASKWHIYDPTVIWYNFNLSASVAVDNNSANDETVDGVSARHMKANAALLPALDLGNWGSGDMAGNIDIWVTTDAMPKVVKMETVNVAIPRMVDTTVTWSKFNAHFDIKAPTNVQ